MNENEIQGDDNSEQQEHVEVSEITPVSPHHNAIYEAGKKMLIDSIDVGKNFSQFMITLSATLIMVYVGILKFLGIDKTASSASRLSFIYIVPPILFLISCAIFIVNYFPKTGKFSLDIIEEIKSARNNVIDKSQNLIKWGVIIFLFAMFTSILLFAISLSIL